MNWIDTHTHLFLEQFKDDREDVIKRAIDSGVYKLLLPNIDSKSIDDLKETVKLFPDNCYPMIGLHPTSVDNNFTSELDLVKSELKSEKYIAIGEIGIDLYWDKTFLKEQQQAFATQLDLALEYNLPVVIHARESFAEIFEVLENYRDSGITGVFHSFTGTLEDANKAIDMGFMIGFNGILTFKNSGLDKIAEQVDIKHILLETDSPYLAPTPYRGKRNESSYVINVGNKLADIKGISIEDVARITTENAERLFNI
ncbi:MAG: TatD family hydrolase [Bacteroidales bacterium]|jgi:TatD DNase family protein|nr:TatD family hydrolase [Bacteroidales bacterium]